MFIALFLHERSLWKCTFKEVFVKRNSFLYFFKIQLFKEFCCINKFADGFKNSKINLPQILLEVVWLSFHFWPLLMIQWIFRSLPMFVGPVGTSHQTLLGGSRHFGGDQAKLEVQLWDWKLVRWECEALVEDKVEPFRQCRSILFLRTKRSIFPAGFPHWELGPVNPI